MRIPAPSNGGQRLNSNLKLFRKRRLSTGTSQPTAQSSILPHLCRTGQNVHWFAAFSVKAPQGRPCPLERPCPHRGAFLLLSCGLPRNLRRVVPAANPQLVVPGYVFIVVERRIAFIARVFLEVCLGLRRDERAVRLLLVP